MKWSYVIPECNLDELHRLIEKANKTARKLNLKEIEITAKNIDHRDLLVREKNTSNSSMWCPEYRFDSEKHEDLGSVRNWINVDIEGDTPKFEGWTFCATLMPVPVDEGEPENQIRKVPGIQLDIPTEYRNRVGECDHCKKNRRRNETYVVHSDDPANEWKMVGSSCIKDFLGHADPHAIAEYLSRINDFGATSGCMDDSEFWGSGKEPDAYNALSVLRLTSAVVRTFGWTSKKQVWDSGYGIATATRVQSFMLPPHKLSPEEREQLKKVKPTEEDTARSEAIFEWMGKIDPESDNEYLYNLSLLSRSAFITSKSFGLLCSAVVAYDRELARKEKAKDYADSTHIGNVKERLELDVTVKRIFEKEGDFGLTRIHHMLTPEGNYLVWFASSRGLEEGQTYRVKATVKKHDEFNGIKQTIVNRVSQVKEKAKV